MARLPYVQPGDLVSSELMNAIIDALSRLEGDTAKLGDGLAKLGDGLAKLGDGLAKLTEIVKKCCEEGDKPDEPDTPGGSKIFIERVDPESALANETVTIIGGGFLPENKVSIGGRPVEKFGLVTEGSIAALVPALEFRRPTRVEVTVENKIGSAQGHMIIVSEASQDKTAIDLIRVTPNKDKVDKGIGYTMAFTVFAPTGNLQVVVDMVAETTGKKIRDVFSQAFSFVRTRSHTFEAQFEMHNLGIRIEVKLMDGAKVVSSQSYPFVIGQLPPPPDAGNTLVGGGIRPPLPPSQLRQRAPKRRKTPATEPK